MRPVPMPSVTLFAGPLAALLLSALWSAAPMAAAGAAQDVCAPYRYPENPPTPHGAQAPIPYSDSLLWLIETPDVRPSHIFATISFDDVRLLSLPEPVREAFSSSRILVMDLEFSPEEDQESSNFILESSGAAGLQRLLMPEMYRRVEGFFKQHWPFLTARLPELKPWSVMLLIMQKNLEPEAQTRAGLNLDLYLQKMLAPARQLPVQGLGKFREQLEIFDNLPIEDQLGMLREIICNLEEIRREELRTLEFYLAGDLESIVRESLVAPIQVLDRELFERVIERLIYQRNKVLAERLQPYLERGGAFVAVDALHLAGKRGLLELLVSSGHAVSPIPLHSGHPAGSVRGPGAAPERSPSIANRNAPPSDFRPAGVAIPQEP